MKHLRTFILLTLISCIVASCADGERMRQRLAYMQACNQADTVFSAHWLPTVDSLVDYFDSHGSSNEQMQAHYLLARTYADMGEAPQALDEFHHAIECADTTASDCNYSQLSRAYGQMAELFYENQLPRNALHAFQQAYRFSALVNEGNVTLNYYAQQGKCYYDLSLPDSALFITEKAIQMLIAHGDTLYANTFKGPMAYSLIEKGDFLKAKEYLNSYEHHSFVTENLLRQDDNFKLLYIYKGFYYQNIEKADSALFFYYKAATTSSNPNNLAQAYRGLCQTYELLHEHDSVGKYAALYVEKNDETIKLASSSALLSMQYLYEYQSFQTLAKQKSLEAAKTRQGLIILSFSLILLVLLSCGTILYLRNRQRLIKQRLYAKYTADMLSFIAVKKEIKILQSQNVINEYRVKQAKNDLEYFRQSIMETSRKYSDIDSWGMTDALRKTHIVEHLKKKGTKGLFATDQELLDLRRLFSVYQPGFIDTLRSSEISLTSKDINVCMLIRLDFVPYEICSLLKISSSALSNQRKRLLKKVFGIDSSASLFDQRIKEMTFESNP